MKKQWKTYYIPNDFYSITIEADTEEEAVSKAMEIDNWRELDVGESHGAEYFAQEVLDA